MNRFNRGGPMSLKPENALKRAEELVAVGQKQNGLQTLHDCITNKRQQRNWTKALEQVMFRYIDLCVDMKQGRKCKDALINYRNTCQQVNVGSLEDVIKYLIKTATDKAEDAQKAAQAALDVEDLEADASPEEMMLSYVSGEKSKDRTDRELVTPWFKFLWETYRNVLDILRNNSRLEALYAMGANRAFQFCLHYKRTTEFRRLCDILRNHLSNLIKYRDQGGRDRTDLTVPASWELYVDMRFDQLRTACDLELWAEAFRSVEDIQGLVAMTPKGIKGPKAQLMATYYAKLTQIFTKSENRLYNAYAWYRLLTFSRLHNKGLTQQDIQGMATNVVLSALAIMPYDQVEARFQDGGSEESLEAERAVKMAGILGFSVGRRDGRALLSRATLLADIDKKGLLALVPPQVKEVYALLEGDFNPLQLCRKIAPLLDALGALAQPLSSASPVAEVHLDIYKPFLQQVAVARMVRQLSEVYSVMRVSSLSELAPYIGFGQAEQLIVDGVKHGYFNARFDHKHNTVHFGGQELESDRVRGHIATMARRLARAVTMIQQQDAAAGGAAAAAAQEREKRRAAAIGRALASAAEENKRLRARKVIIESRKEAAERAQVEREREAEEQRQLAEALAREQEERRKQQERAKREAERIQREMEEREQEELKAYLAARGKKVSEGEILDVKAITKEAVSEQLKQQQELQRKLAKLGKQMDHLERARREEEAPLLAEAQQAALKEGEELFLQEQERARQAARAAWEHDLAEKHRVAKMAEERDTFAAAVAERRAAEFAAIKAARTAALARRREEKRAERDLARRREYVRRCRLEIEEKRRVEEEEARRLEEEKRKREAAERQRKLDELAERQRQREAEIEAKMRAEKEALAAAPAAAAPSAGGKFVPRHLRAGGGGGAAERPAEREPAREPAPAAGGPPRDRSPQRDERPGGAWRPSRGAERDDDRDRAPAPSGGSAWRPSFARGGGADDRREDRDKRPDDRDRRDDGPARSGGGAYRPPVRRDEPPPRGAGRW